MQRDTIFQSMLELYTQEDICFTKLVVSFDEENAADLGGVSRELFSCFWKEVYPHFFDGEICKVPFVPASKMAVAQTVFIKLGRIFSHGYIMTGTIPVKICHASLLAMLFGSEKVSENDLLQSFLSYITPWEKQMVEAGMKGLLIDLPQTQQDEMMALFGRMGMRSAPANSAVDFRKQVINMARSELIYKPSMALNWMKQGIPSSHLNEVS